jgi:hypothetical protein
LAGATGYFFVTVDISETATSGNTISVSAVAAASDLTFDEGTSNFNRAVQHRQEAHKQLQQVLVSLIILIGPITILLEHGLKLNQLPLQMLSVSSNELLIATIVQVGVLLVKGIGLL